VIRHYLAALMTVALAGMLVAAAPPPSLPAPSGSATRLRPLGAVPWETAASTIIDAEERTFQAGGVTLSGTLYTPRDGRTLAAVVAFHGAQFPLRDTPLYRHLPRMLAPLGIAVFVFDRRGSRRSDGDLNDSDYAMLADDGIAAQRMLAADPRIDSTRIGFWGLSQGGWIALLAAQRDPDAAFAISVSAPITQSEPQMLFAIGNSPRIKGYPQAEIDMAVRTRATIAAYYRGESDRAAAQEALDAALPRPWFNLTYLPRALTDPTTSRWPREMANDPLATLEAVRIPVLLLFGARDPWIPVQTSVDRLKTLESRRRIIEWAVIAEADHTMSVSAPPWQQIDPAYMSDDVPEAPDYFSRLAGWLTRMGMTQPRHG
jgi:pimeloyl-ACP methyl ester carboxylesterase